MFGLLSRTSGTRTCTGSLLVVFGLGFRVGSKFLCGGKFPFSNRSTKILLQKNNTTEHVGIPRLKMARQKPEFIRNLVLSSKGHTTSESINQKQTSTMAGKKESPAPRRSSRERKQASSYYSDAKKKLEEELKSPERRYVS